MKTKIMLASGVTVTTVTKRAEVKKLNEKFGFHLNIIGKINLTEKKQVVKQIKERKPKMVSKRVQALRAKAKLDTMFGKLSLGIGLPKWEIFSIIKNYCRTHFAYDSEFNWKVYAFQVWTYAKKHCEYIKNIIRPICESIHNAWFSIGEMLNHKLQSAKSILAEGRMFSL